jgi:hypothetical protein
MHESPTFKHDIIQYEDIQIRSSPSRKVEKIHDTWILSITNARHSEIKFTYLKEFKKTVVRHYCRDGENSHTKSAV